MKIFSISLLPNLGIKQNKNGKIKNADFSCKPTKVASLSMDQKYDKTIKEYSTISKTLDLLNIGFTLNLIA